MNGPRVSGTRHRRREAHLLRLGAAVPSSYYEIRVIGVLPPEALLDFDRLTASVEPVESVVHGPIRDQAALQGLLMRLETLGIEVVEIRRLHGQQPPASEAAAPADRSGDPAAP